MATTELAAASGQPLANFRHQTRMEEQAAFRENLPSTVTDRMYLNLHTDTEASLSLSLFWRPDPGRWDRETWTVAVAGFNNVSRPLRFELVTDTANVTLLEEFNLTAGVAGHTD